MAPTMICPLPSAFPTRKLGVPDTPYREPSLKLACTRLLYLLPAKQEWNWRAVGVSAVEHFF